MSTGHTRRKKKELLVDGWSIGLPEPDSLKDGWVHRAILIFHRFTWRITSELVSLKMRVFSLQTWEQSTILAQILMPNHANNKVDETRVVIWCTENSEIGIQTGGQESLRDGKSLFLSSHICKPQYHGSSGNVSYCFVRADVICETSLSAAPYSSWLLLHKSAGCVT